MLVSGSLVRCTWLSLECFSSNPLEHKSCWLWHRLAWSCTKFRVSLRGDIAREALDNLHSWRPFITCPEKSGKHACLICNTEIRGVGVQSPRGIATTVEACTPRDSWWLIGFRTRVPTLPRAITAGLSSSDVALGFVQVVCKSDVRGSQ